MSRIIKIAYVIPSLDDGGAERQLLELLRRLDRTRFDASLVLFDGRNADRAAGLVTNVLDLGLASRGNARWIGRSLALAGAVVKMRHWFRASKADIIHAVLPAPCILAGTAARLSRVPVLIGSRRSLSAHYRGGGLAAVADRLSVRLADWNIGNSCAVSRDICHDGCPPERVLTIFNGVDTECFHPTAVHTWREMGWGKDHFVFGMVANFRDCKRHLDFVEAAAQLLRRYPQARFLMAGNDAGSLAAVRQRIASLGVEPYSRIVQHDASPEKMYAAMDVYVSASDTEGFSNVVLEAMASGKPVIATAVGGNVEAVVDGVTGLLVPPYAPERIAAAAASLIEDELSRHAMAVQARRRAEEHFSLKTMVQAHEDLYVRALASASARVVHAASAAARE